MCVTSRLTHEQFCQLLNIGGFLPASQVAGASDSSHLQFSKPFFLNRPVKYKNSDPARQRQISCIQLIGVTEFSSDRPSDNVDIYVSLCALFAAL